MKGRTLTLFGIMAAIAAVALIIAHEYITPQGVVLTGGILFILAGLANIIAISRGKASSMGRLFGYMASAASIVFGICMIVFLPSFVPLVTFIFGILIGLLALWQFYILAAGSKPYVLAAWLYVFPIILTVVAVYVLVTKSDAQPLPIILTTGISLAVLALGLLIEGPMLGAARRLALKPKTSETDVKKTDRAEATSSKKEETAGSTKEAAAIGGNEATTAGTGPENAEKKEDKMLQ